MRKPGPAAPDIDVRVELVAAERQVRVIEASIAAFIHVPTMPARMKPVIRNQGKDIR